MPDPKLISTLHFAENNPIETSRDEYASDNDFELKEILIKSPSGGEVDVSQIFTGMSIYEDLFSNTMSVSLSYMDTNDISRHLPIIGQREKIEVSFKIPGDKNIKYEFDVYKVSVKQFSTVGKKQAMVLKGVSSEQFTNIHTKVSQSFFGTIDETISAIFNTYLKDTDSNGKQHKLKIETKTDSERRKFIIPNWHPLDAINWLVERAVAEDNVNASNYVFYQDRNGFHLNTIDALYDVEKPRQEYLYMPRRFRENPKDFREPGFEMRNVQKLSFEEPGDRLEENTRGMYGGRILTHDIVRKTYRFTNHSLKNNFNKTKHVEAHYPIAQSLDNFSDEPNTFFNFCPVHKTLNMKNELYGGETVEQNEKYEQWLLNRNSQLRQIGANIINIHVSGDSRRAPGDVVLLKVTPLQPAIGKDIMYNKYINGKYLITSIRHNITPDGYWMDIELSKDSNAEEYPTSSNFLGSREDNKKATITG